jgi:hypothetical protein
LDGIYGSKLSDCLFEVEVINGRVFILNASNEYVGYSFHMDVQSFLSFDSFYMILGYKEMELS